MESLIDLSRRTGPGDVNVVATALSILGFGGKPIAWAQSPAAADFVLSAWAGPDHYVISCLAPAPFVEYEPLLACDPRNAGGTGLPLTHSTWSEWPEWLRSVRELLQAINPSLGNDVLAKNISSMRAGSPGAGTSHVRFSARTAASRLAGLIDKACYTGLLYGLQLLLGEVWDGYALRNHIILVRQPEEVHIRDGRLHRDGGPAIRFVDGFRCWALRGVPVPQVLAETPAQDLDIHIAISTEWSVDVRREVIEKIGLERIVAGLGARAIDTDGNYTLLEMQVRGWLWRLLKMRNPSIDAYHIEAVAPHCLTVAEALEWRNGAKETPEVLT